MTFRQFAFLNVFRNKRLYIAYFLSSLFTVMVFFTFANFAFHPTLTAADMNANATKGMLAAGGIIYVFSFFFILYSMSSFLQSRKKEFGLLMMQGMSNPQIRWMVFLENMIIGFLATVFGMVLGLVFSKIILMIAENLLVLEGALHFYFPTMALLITFLSFTLLFLVISVFVTFVLRTNKLVSLIKGEEKGKSEPKASLWLTLLAVLLLGSGYAIALLVKGPTVVFAMFPVIGLVVVGTYLLFTQISVYVVRKLKSRRALFWKKTNMLLFSDLSHRMKDNARAFFMVAIISTVAFSAIGTLVGFNSLLTKGLKDANPISFTYLYDDDDDEMPDVDAVLKKHDIEYDEADVRLSNIDQNGVEKLIVTPDVYNKVASLVGEEPIELAANEVASVPPTDANMLQLEDESERSKVVLDDDTTKAVTENKDNIAKPSILPAMTSYFIVGEDVYDELPEPESVNNYAAWQVVDGDEDDIIAAGHELEEENPGVMAVNATVYDTNAVWGPVMFVGLFIGIVFFVSAGSFLYFRLYSDLEDDKEKFAAISKIGLTAGEMNKVISKQMALLFFAPIVVAVIHGAVALTALSHLFNYNFVYEATLVLGSFLVIQIIYFIFVRFFYIRQVRKYIL